MTRGMVPPSTLPPADRRADRIYWRRRNRHYHEWIERHIASLVKPGSRVVDLHCHAGDLLNRVRPSVGLGLTQDARLAAVARQRYPQLQFQVGNPEKVHLEHSYDYVLLPDLVGEISDLWLFLRRLHQQTSPETRGNDLLQLRLGARAESG